MTKFSASSQKWVNKLIPYLFCIFALVLFIHLGRDPLFDWDESIYGELGRELVMSGNLLTNFWNGSVWFEKPPGVSWLAGLGIAIFGGEFGARFFMPILAGLTLYLVYLIGKKLYDWHTGMVAAGLLGSLNLFLDRTRALNTDMPLLLGIAASACTLLYGLPPLAFALAVSASMMFKGLAGLMSVIIVLPLLIKKNSRYLLHATFYILLFTLPWHLYSYAKYGMEFLRPYLLEQVFTRAVSPIEFHLESRWYYFNFLYNNLGIGVLLVAALGAALVAKRLARDKNPQNLFVLWWVFIPLAIFTLAKTRLYWYILPVYPAITLLVAYAVTRGGGTNMSKNLLTIIAFGMVLQAIFAGYKYTDPTRSEPTSTDLLSTVRSLAKFNDRPLIYLVPQSERTAEAILPESQRISSSFRYGGAPSVVYYFGNRVMYFYNTDHFQEFVKSHPDYSVMLSPADSRLIVGRVTITENNSFIGVQ